MKRGLQIKPGYLLLGALAVGGAATWLPSVAVHLLRGAEFSRLDVLLLTGVLPVVAALSVVVLRRMQPSPTIRAVVPLFLLLGIWLLGPFAMFVGATSAGGGFAREHALRDLLALMPLFPLVTFSMSTYDGTLFGLLLATVELIVISVLDVTRLGIRHVRGRTA